MEMNYPNNSLISLKKKHELFILLVNEAVHNLVVYKIDSVIH